MGVVLLNVVKRMALFKYLRPVDNLPDPNGPLSTVIHPSITAEVNRQVRAIEQQPKKRGEYSKHSTEEKAAIGKYAGENGVAAAVLYYKKTKGVILKESLVRDWKKAYLSEVAERRSSVHVSILSMLPLPYCCRQYFLYYHHLVFHLHQVGCPSSYKNNLGFL